MKETYNPKVSIIIPVYNGSNFLREAIDSALAQTYENYEVIVVNDGSNDDGKTEEIALSYGDRIRYIYKENGGVSSALNCGIENMKGEYFSWLSHDDVYTRNKIQNLIHLIKRTCETNLVAMSGVMHIDSHARPVKNVKYYFKKGKVYTGIEVVKYMLNHGTLNGCAMLIPKKAFLDNGMFNETLRYNQDALMWYQIFCNNYNLIVDVDNRDVMYRLHAKQTSKTRRDLLLHDSLEITKIIAPVLIEFSNEKKYFLKRLAKKHARYDCVDAVNKCIEIGKEQNIFDRNDIFYLKCFMLYGKLRNLVKKIYFIIRIK